MSRRLERAAFIIAPERSVIRSAAVSTVTPALIPSLALFRPLALSLLPFFFPVTISLPRQK